MSFYTDSIKKHAVFESIEKMSLLLHDIITNEPLPDLKRMESISRINLILLNFKESLEYANAELISLTWLTEAQNAINQIIIQITNYKNNHNIAHITNAEKQLDNLLNVTAKINLIKSKQSFARSAKALEAHTVFMNAIVVDHNEKLVIASNNLDKIDVQFKVLTNDISKIREGFENSINIEKNRLDQFVPAYQTKLIEYQEKFSDSLQKNKEKFNQEIEKFKSEVIDLNDSSLSAFESKSQALILSTENEFIEYKKKVESESQELIKSTRDEFEEHKRKVRELVGLLSQDTFTYKYRQVADNAHKRAKFWHKIAVCFMMIVTGFAIFAFVISKQKSDWVQLVAKIFATTTMATCAAYSARQASKQEKVERYARKIEMELVAFDPFVSSLDEKLQSELKSEITKRLFGKNNDMEINEIDEAHTIFNKSVSLEELVKVIVSIIGKK